MGQLGARMLFLVAALRYAAALEASGAGAHKLPAAEGQAPTRGSDLQECQVLSLPEFMQLTPKYAPNLPHEDRGFLTTSGAWQTPDGAQLVTWVHDLLGWTRRPLLFYAVGKLSFKSWPIESAARVASDPGPINADPETFLPVLDRDDWDLVFLRDCNNVLTYTIRVHLRNPDMYEVYNRDGELLTRTGTLDHVADHMFFEDMYGKPIAFAQSPAIHGSLPDTHPDDDGQLAPVATALLRPGQEPGMVQPWEIKFVTDGPSNSSLMAPQNRWILAAAVQERAIRAAGAAAQISPWGGVIMTSFVVAVIGFILLMVYLVCSTLFRMVYPLPVHSFKNPYLYRDVEHLEYQASFADGARTMQGYSAAN